MINTTATTANAANSEATMTIIKATNNNAVINDAENVPSVSMTALESLQNGKCFFQLSQYLTDMDIASLLTEQKSQQSIMKTSVSLIISTILLSRNCIQRIA